MPKLELFYRLTGISRRIFFRFINISHFFTIHKLKGIDEKLKIRQQRLSITVHSEFDFKSINNEKIDNSIYSNFAIIFQGKFVNGYQETRFINNAKALRNTYPEIDIIVSTYKEDISDESLFYNLGIKILDCQDVGGLQIPYSANLSRQIETTITGLTYAK